MMLAGCCLAVTAFETTQIFYPGSPAPLPWQVIQFAQGRTAIYPLSLVSVLLSVLALMSVSGMPSGGGHDEENGPFDRPRETGEYV
jgi:hypothetical protein